MTVHARPDPVNPLRAKPTAVRREEPMTSPRRRWLGITGMPRSGSTFLATMMTTPRAVGYVHEPFNPSCGVRGVNWDDPCLLDDDLRPRPTVQRVIADLLKFRGRLRHHVPRHDPWHRRLGKRLVGGRGPVAFWKAKWTPGLTHAVLKDPVGFYLFPHLSRDHDFEVLVVVKHPVAMVAGHQRVGWLKGIEFLASRPYLMPHLSEVEIEMMRCAADSPAEIVARQWRITYGFLIRQARRFGWTVTTIEEISADPIEQLRGSFERLDLPWTDQTERHIGLQTGAGNDAGPRGNRVQDLRRDSRRVFETQRGKVAAVDRRKIFELTWPLARELYDEASFGLGTR